MSYEQFETIQVQTDGALAIVTIAREAQLNALSSKVIAELTHACGELEVSGDVRCVIVTGAGKAFVAGADIAEMRELSPRQAQAFSEMGGALAASIEGSEKPWIAAVNGFALGGGCELALACDFIYASDQAKFGQPEVKLGIIPGFGGTQRLPRLVGPNKALEMNLVGDAVLAGEALEFGLVNRVVPDHELFETALMWGRKLAAQAPVARGQIKSASHKGDLDEGIEAEKGGFEAVFASEDGREGISAFLGKRVPTWRGR